MHPRITLVDIMLSHSDDADKMHEEKKRNSGIHN